MAGRIHGRENLVVKVLSFPVVNSGHYAKIPSDSQISCVSVLYYANSIYITKEAEYTQRRGYLNQAIGNHRLKRLYSVCPMDLFPYLGQRLIVSGTHTFYKCDFPLYPNQIPCDWKASTQRYEANVMLKTLEIKQSIESGAYHPSKCKEFILSERGKVRPVKAPSIDLCSSFSPGP